jgi:hypothetical protein
MTNKNSVFNQIEFELSFVRNAHGECNMYIDFNVVFVTKMSCSNCDMDLTHFIFDYIATFEAIYLCTLQFF